MIEEEKVAAGVEVFDALPQVLKSLAASGFLVLLPRAYFMGLTAMNRSSIHSIDIEPLYLGYVQHRRRKMVSLAFETVDYNRLYIYI